jgi:putative PIG3 family NAD(P)H quinone oxidoreductase
MRAVIAPEPGGPEALVVADLPDPVPGPGEVLVQMTATAVNRADTLQRQGFYPPPPGASDVLGLECSGTVAGVGPEVSGWSVGDEVCALLAGGGYAERVLVPAGQVMPVPDGVDLVTAGALPEVACTVWSNLAMTGHLSEGETLLVHGGTGGIGTHAIQIGKALGARVLATAGSPERLQTCLDLGADVAIDYHDDLPSEVASATDDRGVDVILDNMGASGLKANLTALAVGGRLVIIGLMGGAKTEINLAAMLGRRLSISATTLRGRQVEGPDGKGAIVAGTRDQVWPLISAGRVRPVIHEYVPVAEASRAHAALDEGGVIGKLVLVVRDE